MSSPKVYVNKHRKINNIDQLRKQIRRLQDNSDIDIYGVSRQMNAASTMDNTKAKTKS